jgi:2'-5' RNA ligase
VLAAALSQGGHYKPEDRPFSGHITVARFAGRSRPRPARLQPPPALRFDAGEVTLYRSLPGSGPARDEALETVMLAAS